VPVIPPAVYLILGLIKFALKVSKGTQTIKREKRKENDMDLGKLFRSKTVNFNALVPAIAALATAIGYPIPENVIIGILAIGNFVLRMVTDKPISEK
jgi:hypothetical protein